MKPEKQRTAIAEACGWVLVKDDPDYHEYWQHPHSARKIGKAANPTPFPDYLNDLNAMHEAVMEKLKAHKMCLADFAENLAKVIQVPSSSLALIIATASQRAEAFLRTIGKWEDDA